MGEGKGEGFVRALRETFPKVLAEVSGKVSAEPSGKPFDDISRKTSPNQRAESGEQRAEDSSGRRNKEGTASTHARESIPKFKNKVEAGRWVSDNLSIEPMDDDFDRAVAAVMKGYYPDMVDDGFDAV